MPRTVRRVVPRRLLPGRLLPRRLLAQCALALCLAPPPGGDRAAAADRASGPPISPPEHRPGVASLPSDGASESRAAIEGGDDVDTEHIFGFTLGTDIGKKGEIEPEIENAASFGKRYGTYFGTSSLAQLKYTATDNFRAAPGILVTTHNIGGISGLSDRRQGAVAGASLELSYKLLDHQTDPFGLTLKIAPGWNGFDAFSGARVEQYGADFAVLIDKEIIPSQLFGAFNFNYGLATTRLGATGARSQASAASVNLALTAEVVPELFIGAEARYLQQYEGSSLAGEALYLGPTFCIKLGRHAGISGSWNIQAAGRATVLAADARGPLDLVNFERQQVMLRFNTILNPD